MFLGDSTAGEDEKENNSNLTELETTEIVQMRNTPQVAFVYFTFLLTFTYVHF